MLMYTDVKIIFYYKTSITLIIYILYSTFLVLFKHATSGTPKEPKTFDNKMPNMVLIGLKHLLFMQNYHWAWAWKFNIWVNQPQLFLLDSNETEWKTHWKVPWFWDFFFRICIYYRVQEQISIMPMPRYRSKISKLTFLIIFFCHQIIQSKPLTFILELYILKMQSHLRPVHTNSN